MDIDKLIQAVAQVLVFDRFGSLMDIDKLILSGQGSISKASFGSLMDIDKLIRLPEDIPRLLVLVL